MLAFAQRQVKHGAVAHGPQPGKNAFVTNCSGCHGIDATGGDRGPSISAGSNAAKVSDQELKRIIANGIAGAGMPPFASIGNAQISTIVSYLRGLQGKTRSAHMPGDSKRGASLFFGKAHCADCHMAAGQGGFIASDLTGYGESRTPAEIHRAITDPGSSSNEDLKQAVVQMSDGRKFTGIVRTEDNFSVVIQALDGGFVLLHKSELANISFSPGTLMPRDYATTLTPQEIDDLVSYLMSLRARVDPSASRKTQRRGWEDSE